MDLSSTWLPRPADRAAEIADPLARAILLMENGRDVDAAAAFGQWMLSAPTADAMARGGILYELARVRFAIGQGDLETAERVLTTVKRMPATDDALATAALDLGLAGGREHPLVGLVRDA